MLSNQAVNRPLVAGEYVGYSRRQLCYLVAKILQGATLDGSLEHEEPGEGVLFWRHAVDILRSICYLTVAFAKSTMILLKLCFKPTNKNLFFPAFEAELSSLSQFGTSLTRFSYR